MRSPQWIKGDTDKMNFFPRVPNARLDGLERGDHLGDRAVAAPRAFRVSRLMSYDLTFPLTKKQIFFCNLFAARA